MQDYIYGAASGFVQTIIGYPMDTYKTRLQNCIISKRMLWSGIKYPLSSSMFICAGGLEHIINVKRMDSIIRNQDLLVV